jgi:hypothetical protein
VDPKSLFSLSDHLEALSKDVDPLEVLQQTVDFEYFRGWLVEGLGYGDGAKCGFRGDAGHHSDLIPAGIPN